MSISASVRERLLSSFRAELKEHIQTMTDGLLALEQQTVSGDEQQAVLDKVFRAAHSLKGAARSVGTTMIEQLAHALEDILDALRKSTMMATPELYTACYQAFDTIQTVQAAYESGSMTPPPVAVRVLLNLQQFSPEAAASGEKEPAVDAAVSSEKDSAHEAELASVAPGIDVLEAVAPATSDEALDNGAEADTLAVPGVDEAIAPDETPVTETIVPAYVESAALDETIRIKVSKLDALMAQLSELMVTKIRAEQRLAELRQMEVDMGLWQKEWLAVRSVYSQLLRRNGDDHSNGQLDKRVQELLAYLGDNQEQLREMNVRMGALSREYASDTMHMSLVIDELEEEVKRVRMLPLSTITGPFGRMVRDLAYEAEKDIILRIIGAETELDKRVLEQIKDPLIHLLRNAVDHGIEATEQRLASGKPRQGVVTLSAEQLGNDVLITVQDDGGGLDFEGIRRAVARRDADLAQSMNEAELKAAMFNVGVSTSQVITDISGRGVGLDVVRRNVEALHGRIDVDTAPGEGTCFVLTLPMTLSSSRGLMVVVSGERLAIPLGNIDRIMDVSPDDITTLGGFDAIIYNDRTIPLVRLGDVLELPRRDSGAAQGVERPVVVLASAERRMAFMVDNLVGEQEIVIKGLGKQLSRVGGIAGATVMGNGSIVLILNVADVIKMALRGQPRAVIERTLDPTPAKAEKHHKAARAQQRILVVDDSITTRTLEKNILEAAGYYVHLATDGQEAWDTLASGEIPDLVVSDVSMPRMDGIGLAMRIKGDARTRETPIILVTSLDSPQDKARGIEAGADAYITKGTFDQSNLLATIEQLI